MLACTCFILSLIAACSIKRKVITAKDIEAIMAKAPAGPVQTIRIEQAPLKITTDDKPYKL